jgi:hypothetical protein
VYVREGFFFLFFPIKISLRLTFPRQLDTTGTVRNWMGKHRKWNSGNPEDQAMKNEKHKKKV